MKNLHLTLGIVLSICALVGVVFGLDQRFAKSTDVEFIAMRLDQKILQDQYFDIKKRIWALETHCTNNPASCTHHVKEEIRLLKEDLKRIEDELKRLKHKG